MITLKCAACGFVSDVDMRDKLTTFILKNPPEQKKGAGKDKKAMRRAEKERLKEGEAADEEMKKLKKEAKKKGASKESTSSKSGAGKKKAAAGSDEDHSNSPTRSHDGDNVAADEDDDDDVQWQTDTSLEAAKQRMQEQLSAATAEMVMLSTEEPEKKKKHEASHKEGASNGSTKHVVEEAKSSPYDDLVKEMKDNLSKGANAVQLKGLMTSSALPPQDAMNALFDALFGGLGKGFAKEVVKKKKFLAAAVPDEASQMVLLQALVAFGAKSSPEAVKEVPIVLKALYDGDVLDEEVITQWYNESVAGGKESQVVKNAKPFVEWLQSADSESEEE
nr:putative eukaryotic translation initiation factor 5 [Oryza sativa Japonica Group]